MSPHTLILFSGLAIIVGLHVWAHLWFVSEYPTESRAQNDLSPVPEAEGFDDCENLSDGPQTGTEAELLTVH